MTRNAGGKFLIASGCGCERSCWRLRHRNWQRTIYSNSRRADRGAREEEQCATDGVPVDQFAAPGSYRVISAPAAATPGTPVLIVVARATGAH